MFYIKLTEDKDLEITAREPIYRGERLNGKLVFLLPEQVDELQVEESLVYLSYIRADGHADVVCLNRLEEKYNGAYFQYTLPITSYLTRFPGQMNAFLQIYSGDPVNPQIVKSGEVCLTVEESPNMDEYLNADRVITAIYQHDKSMQERLDALTGGNTQNGESGTQGGDEPQNGENTSQNGEDEPQNTEPGNEDPDANDQNG